MMKRSFYALLGMALCAAVGFSCSAGGDAQAEPADPLRAALRPEWFQFESDHRNPANDHLVVVIGESHASTLGQIHEGELLQHLLDAGLIDAILVEGSEGPIDTRDFNAEMTKLLPGEQLAAHWRRELEWGKIAGWELVVLTRPQTTAFGVEDMAAKTRYFLTDVNGSEKDLQSQLASWERGGARLEAAIAALEQAGLAQPKARSALSQYRQGLREYAGSIQRFAALRQPLVTQQLEAVDASEELEKLFQDTGLAELRGKKDAEELFEQRMKQLLSEQPEQFNRMVELMRKLQELEQKLPQGGDTLAPVTAALGKQDDAIEDAYFTVANQLRNAAAAKWVQSVSAPPAEVASALAGMDSFFRDEVKRQNEQERTGSREELAGRDRAMAANTERYLREHSARRVALIIGSAHLPGMTAELTSLGVPFVSGRLVHDESEPWEDQAYEERLKRQEKVLSLGGYAPWSHLLDPVWREQQKVLVEKGGSQPPAAGTPASSNRSFHQGALLAGKEVRRGAQVVAWGPVPGRPGEIFEQWDRKIGRGFVKQLSDGRLEFVFGFHQRDAQGRLRHTLVTRQGDQSLQDFRMTPPGKKGKRPDYVVTFYEPDFLLEGKTPYSPLWQELRDPGDMQAAQVPPIGPPRKPPGPPGMPDADPGRPDNNEGDKRNDDDENPPSGDDGEPPSWTAFWGRRDPERPRVIRTYDPERARLKLERVLEQKPLDPSEVQFVDDLEALKDAPFAQRDGTNAGMVVLVAQNTAEFRTALREAAEGRKLVNKQVVLITCGNAFPETTAMRELLLSYGALMVWTPDRQITPEAGERLRDQIRESHQQADGEGQRPRDIDELTSRAIQDLIDADPENPNLQVLRESGSWAILLPPASATEEDRHA